MTVSSGRWDRLEVIATFAVPGKLSSAQLRDSDGRIIPLQIDDAGQASFIVDSLAKEASRSFEFVEAAPNSTPTPAVVQVMRAGKKLKINHRGKPILEYQAEPGELPRTDLDSIYQRGGYLHPILTPAGRPITDDYPSNHKHHHGVWFPWTKTEFEGRQPDFWNMGDGKGRVEFVAIDQTWNGPVHGGFRARHRFVDMLAKPAKAALNESWEVRVYNVTGKERPLWMFDLTSTQECASASPLKLLNYYYGGLGFRGNWDWNGTNKTFFLTSEGVTDRVKGNQTRARWCHIGGRVDGQMAGVAILGHPDNFRAPQPVRLHPGEPFFCFAPSQLGDFQIDPGQKYRSRYRFVVQDGSPDRAELERLWHDYAEPPRVTVESR